MRLQPDLPIVHHNLGNALRALNRDVEARAAYLDALRLDPDLAPAHAHIGWTLLREDRPHEALPWLKQAVELDPNNGSFQGSLGDLFEELGEPTQAIACLEHALSLAGDDRAGLHLSLGRAKEGDGRVDEAETHYHVALRLQPDSPSVQVQLGGLHEIRGNLDEAEAAFRKSMAIQPMFPAAHARLATLLRGRLPDEDLAALEARLADLQLGGRPRARLLFGLAHVLDGRGEYDRAAECLREANALSSRKTWGDCSAPVDSGSVADRLLEVFGTDFFTRIAGFGSDSRRPVFVFGLPRSGTTLIEQVLASHSLIHGAGELGLAQRSFESLPAMVGRPGPPLECVAHLDEAVILRLAVQHLEWLSARDKGRVERIVDKMPGNYTHLGLLATLFPWATFIHCRRDLRDVAVSCWMTHFSMIHWANNPDHIADQFRLYRRLMGHWQSVLPVPIHEVDYEETVADLEGMRAG